MPDRPVLPPSKISVITSKPQHWDWGVQNNDVDPARRLITLSEHRHDRPYLQSGDKVFAWPVGVEGLRRSGTASLGIHRYLGENSVDVQVLHKDEARIEMTGTFPGIT